MEGLLAEINTKRKALEDLDKGEGSSTANKYMRRADIERAQEEEAKRKRMAAREADRAAKMRREAEAAKKSSLARLASPSLNRSTPDPTGGSSSGVTSTTTETFNISPEEIVRRLRAKGQPIRFFGETDKDRKARLRALELLEERGGSKAQGHNDFRKLMADLDSGYEAREEEKKTKAAHRTAEGSTDAGKAIGGGGEKADAAGTEGGEGVVDILAGEGKKSDKRKGEDLGVLDLNLIRTDPNKLYPLIYYAWKNLLKEWEAWMDARPEEVKRSTQGKLAAANQIASTQHLKPLFKQIRSRNLPPDVLRLMAEIVHYVQTRSYQQANDAYLRMSIGNAAWPIGVTSVGLHERSADQKIAQDVVAHVMNDEVSRKWIQAIKRSRLWYDTPSRLASDMIRADPTNLSSF